MVYILSLCCICSTYGEHAQHTYCEHAQNTDDMMTMLWPLDQWLWKSFHCYIGLEKLTQNDSYIAKIHLLNRNMEMFFSMSADVYSDLTIQLALKNYHKMTLKLPKSIHWFKRYSEINFFVSWCHCWIGLEKLPQNSTRSEVMEHIPVHYNLFVALFPAVLGRWFVGCKTGWNRKPAAGYVVPL